VQPVSKQVSPTWRRNEEIWWKEIKTGLRIRKQDLLISESYSKLSVAIEELSYADASAGQ
jgi:hypothetical protein